MPDSDDDYPQWYHPDYRVKDRGLQLLPELQKGSKRWDNNVNRSVVRLVFLKGEAGQKKGYVGTGFILYLPSEATPNELVILTAGHNLATELGTRTENMRLYFETGEEVKVDNDPNSPGNQTYLSKDYNATSGPDADYGFIRVPIPATKPANEKWGFGFSLHFFYSPPTNLRELKVTGYTPEPKCVDMTGPPMSFKDTEIEYDMDTEKGISGSPVWLAYENSPVVIAIHNNGKDKKKPKMGSRGAPITAKLLYILYEWLKFPESVLVQNKKLRAVGPKSNTVRPQGLFLSFTLPHGRVRLRTGSLFDKFLVQTVPARETFGFVYALRLSGNNKWVQYNTKSGRVLLDEKLGRDCFSFWEKKTNGDYKIQVGESTKSTVSWRTLRLGQDYVGVGRETMEVFLDSSTDKIPFYFFSLS